MINGGTPGQTRTDGAHSGSGEPGGGRTASPVGLHRVIEPAPITVTTARGTVVVPVSASGTVSAG